MRKLIFIMSMLLIGVFGCEKSEVYSEKEYNLSGLPEIEAMVDVAPSLNFNGHKMVPLMGSVTEIADLSNMISCGGAPYPTRWNDIEGQITHLGNAAGGYAEVIDCEVEFREDGPYIIAYFEGVLMASNGDEVWYDGSLWFLATDPTNPNSGGSAFDIYGGTGRWVGAKGYFETTIDRPNPEDPTVIIVNIYGEITPPGAIK